MQFICKPITDRNVWMSSSCWSTRDEAEGTERFWQNIGLKPLLLPRPLEEGLSWLTWGARNRSGCGAVTFCTATHSQLCIKFRDFECFTLSEYHGHGAYRSITSSSCVLTMRESTFFQSSGPNQSRETTSPASMSATPDCERHTKRAAL